VNATELFLLGRKLMQIAEGSLPQGRIATSVRLVLADVAYHPNSSITEITERTGFPQSLVSTAVAKLRALGVVESERDPCDGRRTLVRATPRMEERAERAGATSIDPVLAELAGEHRERVPEAVAALELLAGLLTPELSAHDPELSPSDVHQPLEEAKR
jgi:DNA-binding MarR family transcriptional regulator